jgi:hypothetical protein
VTLAMLTGVGSAQQRTFYDSSGKVVGRATLGLTKVMLQDEH